MPFIILQNDLGHISCPAIDFDAMGFVAAGTQDGASDGENPGQRLLVKLESVVQSQSAKSVAEGDDIHVVESKGSLADAANGCVKAGAVATGGEDANAFALAHKASVGDRALGGKRNWGRVRCA